jgi:hypothetical protein
MKRDWRRRAALIARKLVDAIYHSRGKTKGIQLVKAYGFLRRQTEPARFQAFRIQPQTQANRLKEIEFVTFLQ